MPIKTFIFLINAIFIILAYLHVFICVKKFVCVCERGREREREKEVYMRENGFGTPRVYHITIKNRFIFLDGQSEKISRTNF